MELNVPNFDVLLYHPDRHRTIFVECKSGLARPNKVIEDLKAAREAVLAHGDVLEDAVGDEVGFCEYVLCVPAEQVNRLLRHLEQRDDLGFLDEAQEVPLLVWSVNKFDKQTLSLITRMRGREDRFTQHGDGGLTNLLTDGAEVDDAEVTYRGYPSSHLLRLSDEALTHILLENARQDQELKSFHRDQMEAFFSNPRFIPHYALDDLGERLTRNVIDRGLSFGLLKEDDNEGDRFHINLDVKQVKTIRRNYKEAYLDAAGDELAHRWAGKEALEEFKEKRPPLEEFDE